MNGHSLAITSTEMLFCAALHCNCEMLKLTIPEIDNKIERDSEHLYQYYSSYYLYILYICLYIYWIFLCKSKYLYSWIEVKVRIKIFWSAVWINLIVTQVLLTNPTRVKVQDQQITRCKLLTTSNKLGGSGTCYKVVPTRLIQSWYNNIPTALCCQLCYNLDITGLYQICYRANLEQVWHSWQAC